MSQDSKIKVRTFSKLMKNKRTGIIELKTLFTVSLVYFLWLEKQIITTGGNTSKHAHSNYHYHLTYSSFV